MCLNHPETTLCLLGPWKKLSSTKLAPGAKKVGDRCLGNLTLKKKIKGMISPHFKWS